MPERPEAVLKEIGQTVLHGAAEKGLRRKKVKEVEGKVRHAGGLSKLVRL